MLRTFRRFCLPCCLPSKDSAPFNQNSATTSAFAKMSILGTNQTLTKLRETGYAFNDLGQLRKIDKATGEITNKPFEFTICNDDGINQQNYEKVADQVPEIIYEMLEENGLTRTYIPEGLPKEEASFIFTQPAKLEKSKKLIVLIHGSGFVRAGQWARSLIINNSLDHGSQLPYIKRAKALGYDILLTNTNDTHRRINGVRGPIPQVGSAVAHAAYVWEKIIMPSEPEAVAIVAHSAGGGITMELAKRFPKFFTERVFAIAFTDSAHSVPPPEVADIMKKVGCNWVSSFSPLDEVIEMKEVMKVVSAGHKKHEWASYSAFESVFKYLEKKYDEFTSGEPSKKQMKMDKD